MADRSGEVFGDYRLIRFLGKGGFAEVYLGEHIHLQTNAAIKLLLTQVSTEEEEQFREEARTDLRCNVKDIFPEAATRLEGSEQEPTCKGSRML